jgi:hypothetical protein
MRHLAFRVVRRAKREVSAVVGRICDANRQTYPPVDGRTLTPRIEHLDGAMLGSRMHELRGLAELWLSHRFDLLGSGWVQVRHGMACSGLEGIVFAPAAPVVADADGEWLRPLVGSSNLQESQRLWRMIDRDYTPIDWQLDFKSGYRWNERTWYRDIRFGHTPGTDVKVPWELARMQHLVTLALSYVLERADRYRREFRNEVLDFIATNPPRYGVNWRTAMDVGIRAANWVLAWDLFRSAGAEFDDDFERTLCASVCAHADHVMSNLEWEPVERGNHYLADIACLAIVASYTTADPRAEGWLAFARRELVKEVERQFFESGGAFEASTCYHRLSLELALFASAILLGGSTEAFPASFVRRLAAAIDLTSDLTRPDGTVPQIGDNDNGRLFKLAAPYEQHTVAAARARFSNLPRFDELPDDAGFPLERHLDHRQLVIAGRALLGEAEAVDTGKAVFIDGEVILALSRGRRLTGPQPASRHAPASGQPAESPSRRVAETPSRRVNFSVPGGSARAGLVCRWYPEFGVCVFRGERVHVVLRCGGISSETLLAHAHADQLHVEVFIDGVSVVADPGTYVYTALPSRRDEYRAATAHFVPRVADEQQARCTAVFRFEPKGTGRLVELSDTAAVAEYDGYSRRVRRRVSIEEDRISVADFGTDADHCAAEGTWLTSVPFSPGYGMQLRAVAQ